MDVFELLGTTDNKKEVFHPWLPAWAYNDEELCGIKKEYKCDENGWYEIVEVKETQYYNKSQ